MSLDDQIVAEEDKHVDFAFCYHGTDLLVTSERAGEKSCHLPFEWFCQLAFLFYFKFGNEFARRSCCVQIVLGEFGMIEADPLKELLFAPVVGDQCDVDLFHTFRILSFGRYKCSKKESLL